MKEFLRVAFDPVKCRLELAEFRNLLASKQNLEEATDIKPFFESHLHLAAFVGCYGADITHYEFSQLVDWFGKLDDMARTDEFEVRFGARNIRYFGLLIAGRDAHLTHARERRRWEWRGQKVLVDSLPVLNVTYDQLWQFLSDKLNVRYPNGGLVPG